MPEPGARDHSAGRALASEWADRLASGVSADDVEAAILAAPAADAIPALRALAEAHGETAAPMLERLGLSERRDLALAAAEALGTVKTNPAAEALERIAAGSPDKAVQKAARRSSYR